MIYAVDIDGTLCVESEKWWEYHKAIPNKKAIAKINVLFGQDHRIIIYTARPECDREVTTMWLDEHKVRYHKLVMGKIRADVYVDNAAKRIDEI